MGIESLERKISNDIMNRDLSDFVIDEEFIKEGMKYVSTDCGLIRIRTDEEVNTLFRERDSEDSIMEKFQSKLYLWKEKWDLRRIKGKGENK